MFLVGLLFLGIALLPVLVVFGAAIRAVHLLYLVAADALAATPAPACGRSLPARRVARPRPIDAGVAA